MRVNQVPGIKPPTSYHIKPADIAAPGGLAAIEQTVIAPLAGLRGSGQIELTDTFVF